MSAQFLSPFADWVICILGINFLSSLWILEISTLSEVCVVKVFFYSVGSLHITDSSFAEKKVFSLNLSQLLIPAFISCA